MTIGLLVLSMTPLVLWAASLAVVSVMRPTAPLMLRSERLAGWSYAATYCVLWATVVLIASLWPVVR